MLLFISQTYVGMLMPVLNAESVRQHTDLPFHTWRDDEGPSAALADLITRCAVDTANLTLSLDEGMRADFALRVLDALPGARRQFTDATISLLRAEKTEAEYRALKTGAVLNDGAVMAGFDALREGISEAEVADIIAAAYAKAGASPNSYRSALPETGRFAIITPAHRA